MKSENLYEINKKIYYHDTDCGGVVYYSNYLKYFEEARTEQLRSKGIDLNKLLKEEGLLFAVASLDIRYKGPARYGDELLVLSKIEKLKPASIDFYHQIKKASRVLVECRTKLVSINIKFKPQPLSDNTLALLGKL